MLIVAFCRCDVIAFTIICKLASIIWFAHRLIFVRLCIREIIFAKNNFLSIIVLCERLSVVSCDNASKLGPK